MYEQMQTYFPETFPAKKTARNSCILRPHTSVRPQMVYNVKNIGVKEWIYFMMKISDE